MKQTKIVAAFCGSGKTYICSNTIFDAIEVEFWKYKDCGNIEMYINDVKKHIGTLDYIFISTDPEGMKILHENDVQITLVYPDIELRNEYLDRYIERDSSVDFIGAFMKYWEPWISELKKQNYCEHIVLHKNQFLLDVLL